MQSRFARGTDASERSPRNTRAAEEDLNLAGVSVQGVIRLGGLGRNRSGFDRE